MGVYPACEKNMSYLCEIGFHHGFLRLPILLP